MSKFDALDSAMGDTSQPDNKFAVLDEVFARRKRQQDEQLRQTLDLVAGDNPDQAARARNDAATLGVPQDVAQRNPDDAARRARVAEVLRLAQDNPVLRRQLTDPNFARVAHDDAENLSTLGTALRALRNTPQAAYSGLLSANAGIVDAARLTTDLFARAPGNRLLGLDAPLENLSGALSAYSDSIRSGIKRPESGGNTEAGYYSGVESFVQNAALLPLALLPGGEPAALYGMVTPVVGNEYDSARDAGLSERQAAAYAISQGAIEYVTEKLPLSKLLGSVKAGDPFIKTLAKNLGYEVAGEQIATIFQDLNEWAALNPEKPFSDYLDERPDAAAQTLVATLVGAGAQTALVKGIDTGAQRLSRAYSAQRAAEQLERLDKLAEASKVRARSPDQFQTFIEAAAEDGAEHVYIDGKTFLQSGVAPQIEESLPGITEQATAAAQTGGEVQIRLSDFVAKVAGTEAGKALIDDVRVQDEDFTRRGANEFLAQQGEALRNEIEQQIASTEERQTFEDSAQAVEDNLVASLEQSGRVKPDAARAYAQLHRSVFSTLALRLGTDPKTLFDQFGLKVTGEPLAEGAVLNQAPDTPEFKAWFGDSKVVGNNGEPLVVYHGAGRPDRVGDRFRKSRATSGPMAFFTDSAELASRYAVDKQDTSLEAPENYADWFTFKTGARKVDLDAAWHQLTAKQQSELLNKLPRVRNYDPETDTELDTPDLGPEGTTGVTDRGHWDYEIQQARGNVLQAARSVWLDSGLLYGNEREFLDVLKAAGAPPGFSLDDPNAAAPFVYPVYLGIKSPLDTSNIPDSVVVGLQLMAQKKRRSKKPAGVDFWDKRSRDVREWVNQMVEDLDSGTNSFVWSSIPDAVTEVLRAQGYDGIKDTGGKSGGDEHTVWIPFEDTQVKSALGNRGTFDPNSPNILRQDARGTFDPETNTLSLLKNADLSTFLHESGHFFLEVQTQIAQQLQAKGDAATAQERQFLGDTQTVLQWFGIDSLEAWQGMTLEEKRPYHEQWAEAFESYLLSGKAPSVELMPAFRRFRQFMLSAYRSVKRFLQANPRAGKLNDDVRQVFDRLIATDEQIDLARQSQSMAALFATAEQAGMTAEEFASYQRLAQEDVDLAREKLQARSLRDLKWVRNAHSKALKALQREARALRREVREEVREEVLSEPLYRAWDFLRGKLDEQAEPISAGRLNRAALEELGLPENILQRIKRLGMTAEDGLPPDLVAEWFQFGSGAELATKLAEATAKNEEIEGRTDQRMLEQHGDLATPEALARAADQAVHNEARARMAATEANALAKATGRRKILVPAAKAYAEEIISRLRVRDLRPHQYTLAERKAAKLAEAAMRKNDLGTAAAESRNRVIQNQAARAALDAQEEVDKDVRYLRRVSRPEARKAMDPDYADQIDALLERFELKAVSNKEIDRRTAISKWLANQAEQGLAPEVPDWLAEASTRTHYRNLTVEEFRALVDSIKQIEHLGRLKNRLLTAKDKREFAAVEEEISASIRVNGGKPLPINIEDSGRLNKWWQGFRAGNRKLSSLARQMDGGQELGPMYRYLIEGMNERGAREAADNEKAVETLAALFKPILALKGGTTGDKRFIPGAGVSLTRGGRLAVALNWGNEANRQRLTSSDYGSGPLTPPKVDAVLSTLSREEWAFVQGVWDFIDSYWPQISAKQRRVYGVSPEKVEAAPFTRTLSDGSTIDLKGGYYPIKYDASKDDRAATQETAQIADEIKRGAYTAATTRRGHTKTRAEEVKRPVRLSLDVITEHVAQVTHDLAWHEWLIDANRLLRSRKVGAAVRDHYGDAVLRTMREALVGIAGAELGMQSTVDQLLLYLRANVSRSTMGLSLTTALLQPFGLLQSAARIGPKYVLRGMARWAGDAAQLENTLNDIREKSDFMRLRAKTFNRELYEIRGRVTGGKSRARQAYDSSLFAIITRMQLVADVPTWIGGYEKALDSGSTEEQAVLLADRAVIESQGSGQQKDLSAIQRDHPMLTMFYSYFNVTLQLTAESTARTDFRRPLAVAGWLGDMMLLNVIPALGPALILALLRGEGGDDEPEDWAKKLTKWELAYLFGLVPGLREFSGVVEGYDYAGPPVGRAVKDTGNLAAQVGQGEADEAAVTAFARLLGTVFGLPVTQAIRSYKGWQAWVDDEAPASSVLVGPPRDD